MVGAAMGAVNSLLGVLARVLVDEARLLGRVRGDMVFIKDEMESIGAFLRHHAQVAGDSEPDPQVSAWMKQVQELAYNCQNCVDRYVLSFGAGPRDKGFLAKLRRTPRFLWTMPTRHRIAKEIRDLRVHAHDVGERQTRYQVRVPDAPANQQALQRTRTAPPDTGKELEDDNRRRALDVDEADFIRWCADEVNEWLTEQQQEAPLRVIPIIGWDGPGEDPVARQVYDHASVARSFECKAWITVGEGADITRILGEILAQVLPPGQMNNSKEQCQERLQGHVNGKRLLIVLSRVWDDSVWSDIKTALPAAGSTAIILTTGRTCEVAIRCSPYKTFNHSHDHLTNFFMKRADTLIANNPNKDSLLPIIQRILSQCERHDFSMKMFLHVLYANPNRTMEELLNFAERINPRNGDPAQEMIMFSYNDLPSHYHRCLLYLICFPQGCRIRRSSLVRQWVVEGLVSIRGGLSALDEAGRCFSALVDHGFFRPEEMGATGKVKTCGVHDLVFHFIIWMARYKNFKQMGELLDKDHGLSIHNNINGIEFISACFQPGMLNALDLEGCRGLENNHLGNICNKIILLKYLSIRNTDVTCLPKNISKLQQLETLDIRQTNIQEFPRDVVLPMLKHLLAGHINYHHQDMWPKESVSTVYIPPRIGGMGQMQVLSHVQVSNSTKELEPIARLLQLKKLGVVLQHKGNNLKYLVRVIGRLNKCLRSLSIWIEPSATIEEFRDTSIVEIEFSPPIFLESLNISGIRNGLPPWIEHLHQLIKITLCETHLTESDLCILGNLTCLRCLRLRNKSYIEQKLIFRKGEFQNLRFLDIDGPDIIAVSFGAEATPKLEKMVWSFIIIEYFGGIGHLISLKELELNGQYDDDRVKVKQAIAVHPNRPLFKHNVGCASSSSL